MEGAVTETPGKMKIGLYAMRWLNETSRPKGRLVALAGGRADQTGRLNHAGYGEGSDQNKT